MKKTQLRSLARERAGALGEEYFRDAGRKIAEHIARWEVYRQARVVMAFASTAYEPDTGPLLEMVLRDGKLLALPRITGPGTMEARRVEATATLVTGAYGLMEPDTSWPVIARGEIDLVLAPCMGCDTYGRRLGHGGGYYDRFLAGTEAYAAALCPAGLLMEAVPAEKHDRAMDAVVTEAGIIRRPAGN